MNHGELRLHWIWCKHMTPRLFEYLLSKCYLEMSGIERQIFEIDEILSTDQLPLLLKSMAVKRARKSKSKSWCSQTLPNGQEVLQLMINILWNCNSRRWSGMTRHPQGLYCSSTRLQMGLEHSKTTKSYNDVL